MPIHENPEAIYQRYIEIARQQIPVSEEVYLAYKREAWAKRKRQAREKRCRTENGNRCTRSCQECDLKRAEKGQPPLERTGSVLSMEKFGEEGFEVADTVDIAEFVADKLLKEELYAALKELDTDERSLIGALFYQERTERDYAVEIEMTHQGVNKRKKRVIEKLRGLMEIE